MSLAFNTVVTRIEMMPDHQAIRIHLGPENYFQTRINSIKLMDLQKTTKSMVKIDTISNGYIGVLRFLEDKYEDDIEQSKIDEDKKKEN